MQLYELPVRHPDLKTTEMRMLEISNSDDSQHSRLSWLSMGAFFENHTFVLVVIVIEIPNLRFRGSLAFFAVVCHSYVWVWQYAILQLYF